MGVGEDLNLGDSVSVTIIATGFNADQQNEITNTEPEKIIHSLEDEEGDNLFNQKPIENEISKVEIEEESEEKIVHILDEEPIEEPIEEPGLKNLLKNLLMKQNQLMILK